MYQGSNHEKQLPGRQGGPVVRFWGHFCHQNIPQPPQIPILGEQFDSHCEVFEASAIALAWQMDDLGQKNLIFGASDSRHAPEISRRAAKSWDYVKTQCAATSSAPLTILSLREVFWAPKSSFSWL